MDRYKTQKDKILHHLKTHGGITPKEALFQYGCMRLSAQILNIKEDGVRIVTLIKQDGDAHFAESIGWKRDSRRSMLRHTSITLPTAARIYRYQKHTSRRTDSTMKTELMNTSKKFEHVGTFVWHNLTHDVRVSRDYLNYSELVCPM